MINFIKKNKWVILLLSIVFGILVYCSFQTFIINDDLPYSLFFRETNRITTIKQIIVNQLFDYSHINARMFLHCIVQFLLIFDKNLWSIVNPIFIVSTIALMSYFIIKITGKKEHKLLITGLCTVFYLLLYNYKYLIYWVAGSVNYVFVFILMLLFIIYYFKEGFNKKPLMSLIICFILSMLHESLGIFILITIISDFILKKIKKEKISKIEFKYLGYLISTILGLCVILLSPITLNRMSPDDTWSSYNIIEKLLIAIPAISQRNFGLFEFYNLFPNLLILSIIFALFKMKNKLFLPFTLITLLLGVTAFFLKLNWLTFIIAIIVFFTQSYIFFKEKNYKLIVILLSSFVVVYSVAITPEYIAGRPSYYFGLILSVITLINIFNHLNKTDISLKLLKPIALIALIATILIEINIYYHIGVVKTQREEAILEAKNTSSKLIKLKKIDEPYSKFHVEANCPSDDNYWAYKSFLNYYKLAKDVKVEMVE